MKRITSRMTAAAIGSLAVTMLPGVALGGFTYGTAAPHNNGSYALEDHIVGASFSDSFHPHPGELSFEYHNRGIHGIAQVYSSATGLGATLVTAPGFFGAAGFGQAIIHAEIQVSEATTVRFDWDLNGLVPPEALVFARLRDLTNDQMLVQGTINTAGSEYFTLIPGVQYQYIARFSVTLNENSNGGAIFSSLNIVPAPGVATLPMLAGLFAGCRRRRL